MTQCIHGQLARSCYICELEAMAVELELARKVVEAARRYLNAPFGEVDGDETEWANAGAALELAVKEYDARKT